MATETTITVNGKQHRVQATPDTPLLYVLRNELGLHAAKFGCGVAQCGVCSVLLDQQEIRSCVTPVGEVAGRSITTVEGLADLWAQDQKTPAQTATGPAQPPVHPIQQAWIDLQVPQCGYCQSGMMIQTASLLHTNPAPTNQEIRKALDGHICRCGTHMRIMAAVERAASAMRKEG